MNELAEIVWLGSVLFIILIIISIAMFVRLGKIEDLLTVINETIQRKWGDKGNRFYE